MGIPKHYAEAGRKRHPVTHRLTDPELLDDQTVGIKAIYETPPEVREVLQGLEDKEYEDDVVLSDEAREVMEDIWIKADEMGK